MPTEESSSPRLSSQSNYDLDDAFDDGDEEEMSSFKFTSDSVRNDLAREPNGWRDDTDTDAAHSEPAETLASISTLDINGHELDSPPVLSTSLSSRSALDGAEEELDGTFATISLSEDASAREDEPIKNGGTPESSPPISSPPTKPTHSSYPNVVIDASAAPGHRVTHLPKASGHPDNTSQEDISLAGQLGSTSPAESTHSAPISIPSSSQSPPSIDPIPALAIASTSAPSVPLPQSSSLAVKTHRPTRSTAGPSILDKVVSKTRPSFLPPKPRTEDDKHLRDWNAMMKQSRVAAEKRREELRARRQERENRVEYSIPVWHKEIVPDWRVVQINPGLRRLWWKGIPSKLRPSLWEQAVGNPLALSKDSYRICLARAKRAISRQNFPPEALQAIEDDITTTLPALHIFNRESGPMYQDLYDMLTAWVVSRSDEGLSYEHGVAKLAAMILLNLAPGPGFVMLKNLLERHCLRSIYGGAGAKDDVEAYYRIFDTLLADGMPKIYFNFKQHQISPANYLRDWLAPLFLDHLPFDACARIWDVIVLEDDSFIFRTSLAMLSILEPRLFFPDRTELLELLKGENKAAIEVARREGRRMDGGKYEIYGVEEEALWERIQAMDEWWKESTWKRLIQRELPDI